MTRHTPLRPLFGGKYGSTLLGYVCECGCDGLFTAAGNPSAEQQYVEANHGFQGRYFPNKAHQARVKSR